MDLTEQNLDEAASAGVGCSAEEFDRIAEQFEERQDVAEPKFDLAIGLFEALLDRRPLDVDRSETILQPIGSELLFGSEIVEAFFPNGEAFELSAQTLSHLALHVLRVDDCRFDGTAQVRQLGLPDRDRAEETLG